jgi:mannose-6-phosphate isomerase-like protein (cupin superfamily)
VHVGGEAVARLAERTGISVSTLSRLFEVTLDNLVGLPPPEDPRVDARSFRRNGVTYVSLSRRTDGVVAFKSIHPGARGGRRIRQLTHPGYDWLYVLRGHLRLVLADREHVLEAGEAAEFDTSIPHGLASATEEPVEVLNLMSPHGHRVHLREV